MRWASPFGLAIALLSSHTAAAPLDGTNHTAADIPRQVEEILSKMTFLEKLAQTRNYGGQLQTDLSYDRDAFEEFNLGNGGGSIRRSPCDQLTKGIR